MNSAKKRRKSNRKADKSEGLTNYVECVVCYLHVSNGCLAVKIPINMRIAGLRQCAALAFVRKCEMLMNIKPRLRAES